MGCDKKERKTRRCDKMAQFSVWMERTGHLRADLEPVTKKSHSSHPKLLASPYFIVSGSLSPLPRPPTPWSFFFIYGQTLHGHSQQASYHAKSSFLQGGPHHFCTCYLCCNQSRSPATDPLSFLVCTLNFGLVI